MRKTILYLLCLVVALSVSTPTVNSTEPPRSKFQKLMKKAGKYAEKEFNKAIAPSESETEKMTVKSEIEGLDVDVKSCQADAKGDVIISFTLENTTTTAAEEPSLPTNSVKIFDNAGNSYGDDNVRFAKGRNGFERYRLSIDLPSQVVLKYRMKIMDVDPEATVLKEVMFTVFEPLHTDRRFNGKVFIRNLPITRTTDE